MLTPEETQPAHHRSGVNVEMFFHPVIFRDKWAKLKHVFAPDDVDKECRRLLQVGHGEAHMLCSSQTRDARSRLDAGVGGQSDLRCVPCSAKAFCVSLD